jgi:natural resistance-associated macrophage protein
VCFGISSPDFSGILKGTIVPSCSSDVVVQAVGTLGAVIMPHNLYLHSALVQSRAIDRSNRLAVQESNFYNAIESSCSLFVSFIINACVVSVFSAGFFGTVGASDIGLEQAGDVLGVRYGDAVRYIWAIGLLAAGQSSTMTGTLAGQYVMQGFLDINVSPWVRVMITRSIAIVPAVIVAISSTSNLNTLDELLNVIQSLQLPFALLPLLLFCANPILMQEFIIGIKMKFFVWPLFFAVLGINVYLVQDFAARKIDTNPGTVLGYVAFSIMYFGSMVYLVYWEFWAKHRGIEVNEIAAAEQSPIHSRKAMVDDAKYFRLSEDVKL